MSEWFHNVRSSLLGGFLAETDERYLEQTLDVEGLGCSLSKGRYGGKNKTHTKWHDRARRVSGVRLSGIQAARNWGFRRIDLCSPKQRMESKQCVSGREV